MNKFCKSCGKKVFNSDLCESCDSSSVKTNGISVGGSFYKNTVLNESLNVPPKKEKNLKGLGGWLIVVFLGMIYLLYSYVTLFYSSIKMFTDGTVESLNGIQGFAGALGFEAVMQAILIISLAYLIFLFFKKDKKFPQRYIIFLIVNIIFVAIDTYIVAYGLNYPTDEIKQIFKGPIQDQSTQLVRGIISGIVWIWYMKVSERVKQTFIQN